MSWAIAEGAAAAESYLERALLASAAVKELKHEADSVGRYFRRTKKKLGRQKQGMVSISRKLKRAFRSSLGPSPMFGDPLGSNASPRKGRRRKRAKTSGVSSKSRRSITSHEKGYTRKLRGGSRRTKRSLAKRVSALEDKTSSGMGYLTYVNGDHAGLSASTNQVTYAQYFFSTSQIETAIAQLRDYDITTPASLVSNAQLSGTYNRIISITGVLQTLTLRNNSTGPTRVRVYCIAPKESTNQPATTLIANGFASNVAGALTETSPYVYPTDSKLFTKAYKINCTEDVLLHPGEEQKFTLRSKKFDYNPILADTETDAYQKRYGSCGFLIRVMGVISHDATATTNVGYSPAFVDAVWKIAIKISHTTGTQLGNYKYVAFSPDAQAAGARIGDNNAATAAAVVNA